MSNGVLPPGWALNLSPWYGYVYWSHWHTWRGGRTYVRTLYGRSWRHGYKTKFSHIDGLPYFLKYGAPRARAFGAHGAPLLDNLWYPFVEKTADIFLTGSSVRNTGIERLAGCSRVCSVRFSIYILIFGGPFAFRYWKWHVCSALPFLTKNTKTLGPVHNVTNYHSISSEKNNLTPRQLWASGCLLSYRSPDAGIRNVFWTHMVMTQRGLLQLLTI